MPAHAQASSFEIGDLVSAVPGTAGVMGQLISNPFAAAGCCRGESLGIVLDWHVLQQWVFYDVQWLYPKKLKMMKVNSFFLNKVLGGRGLAND